MPYNFKISSRGISPSRLWFVSQLLRLILFSLVNNVRRILPFFLISTLILICTSPFQLTGGSFVSSTLRTFHKTFGHKLLRYQEANRNDCRLIALSRAASNDGGLDWCIFTSSSCNASMKLSLVIITFSFPDRSGYAAIIFRFSTYSAISGMDSLE